MLKRLISSLLGLVMVMTVFAVPIFADFQLSDSEMAYTQAGSDTVTNAWRYRSGGFGYRIQFVYNTKEAITPESSIFGANNLRSATIVSLGPNATKDLYMSRFGPISFQTIYLPGYDYQNCIHMYNHGSYDSDKALLTPASPLAPGNLATIENLCNATDPFNSSQFILDAPGEFANKIDSPWDPVGDRLRTNFAMDTRDSLTKAALNALSSCLPGYSTDTEKNLFLIAKKVYDTLSPELKTLIGKAPKTYLESGVAEFNDKVLPISSNCVVGWAVVVEPIYRVSIEDGTPSLFDTCFNEFLGSSAEWNLIMGTSAGFAQDKKQWYELMPDDTMQADTAKDEFYDAWHTIIDSGNQQKWGEFASVHSAMEQNFPKSVYTTQGWFGIPADPVPGGFHNPWEGAQGGSGVGVYINVPATPVAEPCCHPANPTGDPCPCGGATPCNCPDGCTCDPDNYTPGCDCVTPRPPVVQTQDPVIEEDHLSQQLNVPNMQSTDCGTDAWYVTFRPEYPGSTYRSASNYSTAWEVVDTVTVEDDWYVQTPGGWWEKHTHEEDVYGTVYYIDNTYTSYKWVLDSFNYDLRIPLDRFVVYSYLKPTQELDLLKAVDGNPMFRLDGSYKDSHTFTYTKGDTTASVGDIFCDPQDVTWVSHRDELGVDSWFNIGLSWYMSQYSQNTASENTLYKQIMSVNGVPSQKLNPGDTVNAGGSNLVLETNNGSQLRDAFENTAGNFQFDFQIKGGNDSLKTPASTKYDPVTTNVTVKGHEFGRYLSMPSLSRLDPAPVPSDFSPWDSVILNPSNFSQNVNVQGSYAGEKSAAPVVSGSQGPSVTVSGNGNTWTFVTPSDIFYFYPSYKMKAATSANGSEQDVWCLSHIERSFQGYNKLTIQLNAAQNDLDAVWSRDYGDSNTAKAGTAYKFTGGGGTIDITGHFLLMDPDFAADPAEQTKINAQIIAAYEAQIQNIVNSVTPNNVSIYSNLYYAGNSPAYRPKVDASFPGSNSGRETIKILSKSASGSMGSSTRTFLPGINGAQTRAHYGATAGDPLGLNDILTQNFEAGSGYTKAWYYEDFEGIVTVTIKASINVGQVTTDMALIEENLSDSRTPANALAQNITVKGPASQTFTKASGQYAIGVELDLGNVSWGQAQADVICMFDPITFNVRGNAYDMAD